MYGFPLNDDKEEELVLERVPQSTEGEQRDLCFVGRFLTDIYINFNVMRSRLASLWGPEKGGCIMKISP
ncbi:conserved hypothetical protein [Ricinus communis]|uniref:DUF4283 domain-containing protein n=1 Tax=Ricinus communis TaxID=3988 RepID=B9SBN9_RICCO|nr:conserved hypothetical protein [Ricinus communis]